MVCSVCKGDGHNKRNCPVVKAGKSQDIPSKVSSPVGKGKANNASTDGSRKEKPAAVESLSQPLDLNEPATENGSEAVIREEIHEDEVRKEEGKPSVEGEAETFIPLEIDAAVDEDVDITEVTEDVPTAQSSEVPAVEAAEEEGHKIPEPLTEGVETLAAAQAETSGVSPVSEVLKSTDEEPKKDVSPPTEISSEKAYPSTEAKSEDVAEAEDVVVSMSIPSGVKEEVTVEAKIPVDAMNHEGVTVEANNIVDAANPEEIIVEAKNIVDAANPEEVTVEAKNTVDAANPEEVTVEGTKDTVEGKAEAKEPVMNRAHTSSGEKLPPAEEDLVQIPSHWHAKPCFKISGLNGKVLAEDLKQLLEPHCKVVSLALTSADRADVAFARLEPLSETDDLEEILKKAVSDVDINDQKLMIEKISVDWLLFVGNLRRDIDDAELNRMFAPFGKIERAFVLRNAEGQTKAYGFVEYSLKSEASSAKVKMGNEDMDGRVLRVEWTDIHHSPSDYFSTILFVDKVAKEVPGIKDKLRATFEQYGKVRDLQMTIGHFGQMRGFGFIDFFHSIHADKAYQDLDGFNLCGSVLKVSFANPGKREELLKQKPQSHPLGMARGPFGGRGPFSPPIGAYGNVGYNRQPYRNSSSFRPDSRYTGSPPGASRPYSSSPVARQASPSGTYHKGLSVQEQQAQIRLALQRQIPSRSPVVAYSAPQQVSRSPYGPGASLVRGISAQQVPIGLSPLLRQQPQQRPLISTVPSAGPTYRQTVPTTARLGAIPSIRPPQGLYSQQLPQPRVAPLPAKPLTALYGSRTGTLQTYGGSTQHQDQLQQQKQQQQQQQHLLQQYDYYTSQHAAAAAGGGGGGGSAAGGESGYDQGYYGAAASGGTAAPAAGAASASYDYTDPYTAAYYAEQGDPAAAQDPATSEYYNYYYAQEGDTTAAAAAAATGTTSGSTTASLEQQWADYYAAQAQQQQLEAAGGSAEVGAKRTAGDASLYPAAAHPTITASQQLYGSYGGSQAAIGDSKRARQGF